MMTKTALVKAKTRGQWLPPPLLLALAPRLLLLWLACGWRRQSVDVADDVVGVFVRLRAVSSLMAFSGVGDRVLRTARLGWRARAGEV
jgi:hypothetical protein